MDLESSLFKNMEEVKVGNKEYVVSKPRREDERRCPGVAQQARKMLMGKQAERDEKRGLQKTAYTNWKHTQSLSVSD